MLSTFLQISLSLFNSMESDNLVVFPNKSLQMCSFPSWSLSNPRARQQEWLVLSTTCIYLFIIDSLFLGDCFAPNHMIVTLPALDYEYDNDEFLCKCSWLTTTLQCQACLSFDGPSTFHSTRKIVRKFIEAWEILSIVVLFKSWCVFAQFFCRTDSSEL